MESIHDLKCQHNLPPRTYTSGKKNPGRQFYRCPKPIEEQCSFFLWVDEAIPSPSQSRVLPPTPQSARTSGPTLQEPPSTPTPSSRKRTSPDDVLSSPPWQTLKRARHGDKTEDAEGHPGTLMAQGSEKITQPHTSGDNLRTLNREGDGGRDGPSMSQETVCSESSEGFSADSVAKNLQFFNELPEYIRKLERRKVAAERSRDARAQKILHLEAEVERLKQREKELEQLVEFLESAQQ